MSDRDGKTMSARHVTAYLTVRGAAEAIDFYREVFGAEEQFRLTEPEGRIGYAELRIGDTPIVVADEYPDFGALSPITIGGSPIKFTLDVVGVDAFFARAVAKGCMAMRPIENQFYGYRGGMVTDPFGYSWFIQEKVEDVGPEEMQTRWNAALSGA